MNKQKLINDPVLGFVNIPNDLTFDIISHPYFQRLHHIVQMGMSFLVYPGAVHTRFNHTIGCMHLMKEALDTLQKKGIEITEEEKNGAYIAILLHDIGHGPFSHVLEHQILPTITHEEVSVLFMESLNTEFGGRLQTALSIFKDEYPKPFLHQLISGQLDVDRLDYLNRDSFYTGVQEGTVGTERIIKMLNVHEGNLVVEEKGIYSIEKFVLSRRLMFWQVYLHKTSVCAEQMLIHILKRAKELISQGKKIFSTPALFPFLSNQYTKEEFTTNPNLLSAFARLDDHDIWICLKTWALDSDPILSLLSKQLYSRNLFCAELQNTNFDLAYISAIKQKAKSIYSLSPTTLSYFVYEKDLTPKTYNPQGGGINILKKNGSIVDITDVSELLDQHFVTKLDVKHLLCYPK
ncbi:MAG: HD domain-containing protein [Bacteroidales bacterium]